MAIFLSILGWVLTWVVIIGIVNAVMAGFKRLFGQNRAFSFVGFLAGLFAAVFVVAGLFPDETSSWKVSYSRVFSFFFTTMKGVLSLLLGIAGIYIGYKSTVTRRNNEKTV